jgi:elongation factor Ts
LKFSKSAGRFGGKKVRESRKSGLIDAYIHANGKVGALVELRCETDFVARNPEFKNLTHDLGMQIAAMHPLFVKSEEVPDEIIHGEREIFTSQVADSGKPANIVNQIVEGKLKKYLGEICLLSQPFIKNQDETVQDQINKLIAKLGENITVGKFSRFEI